MRHRKSGRKLGRTTSHYHATMANLATALLEHKKIKTTTAKAKELRTVVERLISFAKKGDLSSRRQVLRTIRNRTVVKSLFDEIAPTFTERNGGYTRVIKLGQRFGDAAEIAYIELVGFEGVRPKTTTKSKKATPQTADVKTAETAPVTTPTETVTETPVVEPTPAAPEATQKTEAEKS
ncbi:50S ribosomal protein L17 [candidate division KSB1 bacterium]|nr:50S ribosomal protein L17 [candidate division KSB1 bacterium]